MAVIHNDSLYMIIRALENINIKNGIRQSADLDKVCEFIVFRLGSVEIPTRAEDYKKFMSDIEQVQEIFKAFANEDLLTAMLKPFYSGITAHETEPSPTMSIVLLLIECKRIPYTIIRWVLNSGVDDKGLERALMTVCSWLSKWIYTPNLGPLVLSLMQGLEAKEHYYILIDVTRKYIEELFKLLLLESTRESVGPVVLYILEKNQHNPEAFHKVLPHISNVINSLYKESTYSSRDYLNKFVILFMALIDHFPGHPGLYDEVKGILEQFPPGTDYKVTLNCKSWLGVSTSQV